MASLWLSLGFHSWLSEASLLRKTLFFQSLDKRSLHGSDHQYGQLSYVATLGANIFDSSSSWRQPFKNSSSVKLPSLFSSILKQSGGSIFAKARPYWLQLLKDERAGN